MMEEGTVQVLVVVVVGLRAEKAGRDETLSID